MSSSEIKDFIKKPAAIIGGVILGIVLLFFIFFGRGGGQDPMAKSVKNLTNRHQALITVIDNYSGNIKSAKLKSNLSQVSIILTADKNDIDTYYSGLSKDVKKNVVATYKVKPTKDITSKLDEAKISNNLDSELRSSVISELEAIQSATQTIKKDNPDKPKLNVLLDKLILNTQTLLTRMNEVN